MDTDRIARLIEAELPDATVTVGTRSDHPEDDHYRAEVISPSFEGKSLVQQHQLIYEALGEHMTRDIHALELSTYTPAEVADRE